LKIFEDKFTPLQISVKDQEGKQHIVSTKMLTPKKLKKIDEIESNPEINKGDAICLVMELMFDKPKEFWVGFQIGFMRELIDYAAEQRNKKKSTTETE
jgi:hypothetical protein